MTSKFPKLAYQMVLVVFALALVVACNNSDKKEDKSATEEKKTEQAPPTAPVDTTKMDTADTRPVKPGD